MYEVASADVAEQHDAPSDDNDVVDDKYDVHHRDIPNVDAEDVAVLPVVKVDAVALPEDD